MYHLNGHSSVKSLEITLPVCLKSGHYKCCTFFFVCVMWQCLHIESYICFFCIYIPVDLWKIMFHHLLKGALISEIVVYSPLRQTPLCKAVLIYSLSAHSIVDEEEYLVTPVWELVPLPFFFFPRSLGYSTSFGSLLCVLIILNEHFVLSVLCLF